MRKNHAVLPKIAIFCLALALTACGQTGSPSNATTSVNLRQEATEPDVQSEAQGQPVPITHISYTDTLAIQAASEDGVYVLQNIFPTSENIFYIDVATKQEVFLCATPNCKHNTTDCTSYLPLEEGEYGHNIAYFQDSIYLFQCATHAKQPPHLSRMDKDGSNLQDVCFLDEGENFIGKIFGYGDDELLVEIYHVYENGQSSRRLERINCNSGERNVVVEYPDNDYYGLMAAVDDRLAFIKIDSAGRQYFWVDPSSGDLSLEECAKTAPLSPLFDDEQTTYTIQGDYLCKSGTAPKELTATNLITGQVYEVPVPDGLTEDDWFGLAHLLDDQFALTFYSSPPESSLVQILVDPETGALTEQKYTISKTNGRDVIATIQDQVVYYLRSEERKLENQTEYGLVGETCFMDVFGIASKEDFLQGNAGTEVCAAVG